MVNTTERILEYIKQITSDDFDHIEKKIKYIKETIQSAINRFDRLNNKNKNPIKNYPRTSLEKIKRILGNIHKENIIDNIENHMQKLKDNYKLYKIENLNKSYRGPLSGPIAHYNSDIDNIIKTFNEIKKEIFKINYNIKKEILIKIEYVNNELNKNNRVEAKKTNNAPKYYYGQITNINKDNTYEIRFDNGMYRSNTPKSQIRESKISYESLSKIKTYIIQLETHEKKKKLANYLYFLSYINNYDKEVTFDLKDLEIVCNWLKDTSKDEDLKKKLIKQYNNHTELRDNLIEIHFILEKERKPETPKRKSQTRKRKPQTPKRKPQNFIIEKIKVKIENKDDNQKVNSRNNNNNSRNHNSRNNNGRNRNRGGLNSSKPDDKRAAEREKRRAEREKRRKRRLQKYKNRTMLQNTENIKLRF